MFFFFVCKKKNPSLYDLSVVPPFLQLGDSDLKHPCLTCDGIELNRIREILKKHGRGPRTKLTA